jgi:hypothetical protein
VDHGNDYRSTSKTKLGIIFIFLCGIPIFGVLSYIRGLDNGSILYLKNKFNIVNIERNCDWSEVKNYNLCYRKDFLQFVRNKTYYEGTLAFELLLEIKKHDSLKHTTKLGKLNSKLDFLESLISFFEVNRSKSINRDKADFVGLSLAYFKKSLAISEFKNAEELFTDFEKNHFGYIESEPILKNRIKILSNRYYKIKEDIKD